MSSLLEQIGGLTMDSNVVGALQGDLAGLAGNVTGLPTDSINQIVNLAGQIVLPDHHELFGGGANGLTDLVQNGLRDPAELWQSIRSPFTNLEQAVSGGLSGNFTTAFDSLRTIGDGLPNDPQALISKLSDPLREMLASLSESPDTRRLNEFIAKISELLTSLQAAPSQLAALIAEQINNVIAEITGGVTPVSQQLERFIASLNTALNIGALSAGLQTVQDTLMPSSGPAIAEQITSLDLTSPAAVAAVEGQLRLTKVVMEDLGVELESAMAQALSLLDVFKLDAWSQRLIAEAGQVTQTTVNDIDSIFAGWLKSLDSAADLVRNLSLDHVLNDIRGLVGGLKSGLQSFDMQQIKTSIEAGLNEVRGLITPVQDAQTQVLVSLQSIINSINSVLGAVDLSSVTNTITNGINAVHPALEEAETLIDTVSGEMTGVLTSLQTELDKVHQTLTDPDSTVRKAISDFYDSIDNLVPENIPQTLENTGKQVGDVVNKLDTIAFDPVFDAAVEELEDMGKKLSEIDVESLNAILKAALGAALEVFKKFDFPGKVDDFLTEKYDQAVAELTNPAIDFLQHQVDGILEFLHKHGPSELFESLGISEAYENMVSELNKFQPSKALQPVADKVHEVADKLDAYTPSAIMAPILKPVDQISQFVDSLSLDPLFAQLESGLATLTSAIDKLDITSFINDLKEAVNRLRTRIEKALTVNGILDFYRPLHQGVMAGVATVNPQIVLAPLNNFKQAVLDGIEQLDVSVLTAALGTIQTSITSWRLPDFRQRYQELAAPFNNGLNGLDLNNKLSNLRRIRQQINEALTTRGIQTDAVAEESRQLLITMVSEMDPLPILASGVEKYGRLQTAAAGFNQSLSTLLADGSVLEAPLTALAGKLSEVAKITENTSGDLKQILRDAVNQVYDNLGVSRIENIYGELTTSLQSYSPENVENAINDILAPVRDFIDNLLDPEAVFGEVDGLYNDVKGLISPGLNNFLNTLKSELQPLIDSLKNIVLNFNPRAVIAQLDAVYADIVALKDRLLHKFDGLLQGLDAPYEQIMTMLDDLNPQTILIEPLEARYQNILTKLDGIDIKKIFQPLLDALAFLRDELIAGIKRTGDAFNSFLGSAPVGASVSI